MGVAVGLLPGAALASGTSPAVANVAKIQAHGWASRIRKDRFAGSTICSPVFHANGHGRTHRLWLSGLASLPGAGQWPGCAAADSFGM
jgi:hypothetical protein